MWTLIGMGAALVGALLLTLLTYVALSPELLIRLKLNGRRLPQRVREFVGYIIACLLLMVGFFLAGVPLEAEVVPTAVTIVITATPPAETTVILATDTPDNETSNLLTPQPTLEIDTESSGSFGSSLASSEDGEEEEGGSEGDVAPPATEEGEAIEEEETAVQEATATIAASPTPTATSTRVPPSTATATATPTETATPSPEPTFTPVPPQGETAVIQTGGSTLWVRQTPGGRTLTLLRDGDTVVLSRGVASWEGEIWREVRTLDGVLGWIRKEFLVIE